MPTKTDHMISVSAAIPSKPEAAYAVLADYRTGHPSILPEEFSGYAVERGGVGAGTIIRFDMRMLGRTQNLRAEVAEPQPGRVLEETYLDGTVTSFTVEQGDSAGQAQVTITTRIAVRTGLLGRIERFVISRLLRPIYVRELAKLGDYLAVQGS